VIGHDGSYISHLTNNIVACAAVFYCSHTNQYADVTWVERSTKKAANNYRAKTLGACRTQLIIKAAILGRNVLGHGPPTVGCNNMGVVQHGNSPRCPMLEKQPQSDVLWYFKGLMALSIIGGWTQHVYGHADKYLLEAEMSPAQRVNCRADKLATAALMAMVGANKFISSIFLLEKVCVEIAGERVTGSPKNAITELWGEQVAQVLYDRGGGGKQGELPICLPGGHGECTEIVPGDVLGLGNKTRLTFSRDQLTAVTHSKSVQNVCPSCKCHDKSTSHITWCSNPGRAHTLKDLVGQLVQWLHDQQMDGKVAHLFKRYPLAGGTRTLTLLLKPNSRLGVEARYQDHLGWDCFLEGGLCALWVEHRAQHIQRANLMQLADFWAQGLMRRLLQMTHAQWAYRNAMVHLEVKDGWTAAAHKFFL
jgi:hypothetical protein